MNLFESLKVIAKRDIKYKNYIDIHRYRLRILSNLYYNKELDDSLNSIIESSIDPIEGFNKIFDIFFSKTILTSFYLTKFIEKNFINMESFLNKLEDLLHIEHNNNPSIIEEVAPLIQEEDTLHLEPKLEKDISSKLEEDINFDYSFSIEESDSGKYLVIYRDNIVIDSFDDFITILGTNINSNIKNLLQYVEVDGIYYKIGKMSKNSKGFTYDENSELYSKIVNKYIKEYLNGNK